MHRTLHTFFVAALYLATCRPALAQAPVVLQIDIENLVEYQTDTMDTSRYGTNPDITPSAGILRFAPAIAIGDIVAVNGEPAKGTFVGRPWDLTSRTELTPGRPIADISRISVGFRTFELLKPDGTAIGTLMVLGLNGGVSPPGGNFGGQNFAIVGGTGAFLGAGGQQGGRQIPQFTIPPRAASIAEDPANRRLNGGGRVRWLLAIIPMVRPEIVTTNRKAFILHAGNSTPVTGGNPATPGETLSVIASGLGPTVPSVDFGEPFPSSPPAVVNSPLEVTVNGTAAEVLTAIGLPGQVDTYQIQFRVPAGTAPGLATIQITAAWIPGPPVRIPVR